MSNTPLSTPVLHTLPTGPVFLVDIRVSDQASGIGDYRWVLSSALDVVHWLRSPDTVAMNVYLVHGQADEKGGIEPVADMYAAGDVVVMELDSGERLVSVGGAAPAPMTKVLSLDGMS